MTKKKPRTNMAESVRARLVKVRARTGEDYDVLLTRHCCERLLYRLAQSPHKRRFVLKGALMFWIWHPLPHRITRDMDLLGFGEPSVEDLVQLFQEIAAQSVEDDGVIFASDEITGETIREEDVYSGVRIHLRASVGSARVPVQVDIGFGDDADTEPEEIVFPSILEFPAPEVRGYRKESAVAEKFQAMVKLGMVNSRMKDYFDIWFLAQHLAFDGNDLATAIQKTFARRQTEIPWDIPTGLSPEFWGEASRQALWQAFWKKAVKTVPVVPLEEVVRFAAAFLWPAATAAAQGEAFKARWAAGGPWKEDRHGR